MNIIISIAQFLIPYLIKFVDKHSDDFLDMLYKRIRKVLEEGNMATIKFNVMDKNGKKIDNSVAVFSLDLIGSIQKKQTNDELVICGFSKGKNEFTIKADGYKDHIETINFESDNSYIERVVILEEK